MYEVARRRAAGLACWSRPVEPEPLPGGISNTNFLVEHGGRRFVVRIGDDAPEHAVYRFNELTVSQAAHAAGLSPEVWHHEPGALVLAWIEGAQPLSPDAVRVAARLEQLVALLRRCHEALADALHVPGPMFWPFAANRRYLARLREGAARHRDRLSAFAVLNAELEAEVGAIEPVFTHNDLLAANILDDGRRLWLIDWEYGGWNSALFDLANLASNNAFPPELETALLRLYYGSAPTTELWRRYWAMVCASLLRELLWSLTSEETSALDFDYAAYSDQNLARLEHALRRRRAGAPA